MAANWLQITLESERPLDVEHILESCGAISVTILDAADDPLFEPLPGETPLWKLSRISGLFSADADPDAIITIVTRQLGLASAPPHEAELLTDQDWTRAWLNDFRPMRFGTRLWICPTHEQVSEPDAVVIRLDPGLAFGTGTHPTTSMCLKYLDGAPPRDAAVVDFGCGSGVLGIAAALLGASTVHACDIDPQAITATRDNAQANGVGNRLHTAPAGQAPVLSQAADLVLANILSGTLVVLSDQLLALTAHDGRLVLSGILEDQVPDVLAAFSHACELQSHLHQGDWHCLVLQRH